MRALQEVHKQRDLLEEHLTKLTELTTRSMKKMMARLESMENNEGRGQPSSSGAGGEGDGGNNSKGGSKKSTARGEDKGQGLVLYLPYICLLLKLPTYYTSFCGIC